MSSDLPAGLGLASAPFAGRLSREAGIATAALDFIPDPNQADDIVQNGQSHLQINTVAGLNDATPCICLAVAVVALRQPRRVQRRNWIKSEVKMLRR